MHVLMDELHPGETVEISGGAFDGLEGVVTRVMPGRERVAVLLEFLGRQTSVELSSEGVIRETEQRVRSKELRAEAQSARR